MAAIRQEALDRRTRAGQDFVYLLLRGDMANAAALIFSIGHYIAYALYIHNIVNLLHVIR